MRNRTRLALIVLIVASVFPLVIVEKRSARRSEAIADACFAEQLTAYHRLLAAGGRTQTVDPRGILADVLRSPISLPNGKVVEIIKAPRATDRVRWDGRQFVPITGSTFGELERMGLLAPGQVPAGLASLVDHVRELRTIAPK